MGLIEADLDEVADITVFDDNLILIDQHDHSAGRGKPVASIGDGAVLNNPTITGTISGAPTANGIWTFTNQLIASTIAGTLTTAAQPNISGLTNAQLGADTARLNLLTNGGFEVWQRGTGPFTVNSVYTADRWQMGVAGTDTLSISAVTTAANKKPNSNYSAGCTFVLGSGAGGTHLRQVLRTSELGGLLGTQVTLSVEVKTSTANAVRIGIDDGVGAVQYSSYHTGGGSFEKLTATATISPSSTAVVPYVFFAASTTAYLDNAMLVVGSVAATYAPGHPADEQARCERYLTVFGASPGSSNEPLGNGIFTNASQLEWQMYYPKKATIPSYGISAASDWFVTDMVNGAAMTDLAITSLGQQAAMGFSNASVGNYGARYPAHIYVKTASNGIARYYIIANP